MIKTVIFDMDGVIIDSEPIHRYAFFKHYKELELEVSEEEYASYTGASTKNRYQLLKDNHGLEEEIEVMVARKRALFMDAFDTKEDLDLLPGVRELIEDLYSNGMQLILASSSARVTIEKVFNRFELHQYFSHIVSGEDFVNSKPDPAIFVEAVRLSGDEKEKCVIIEDSTNGIKASNRAKVFCIGYKSVHSLGQNYSTADMVIEDFSELSYDIIRKIK